MVSTEISGKDIAEGAGSRIGSVITDNIGLSPGAGFAANIITEIGGNRLGRMGLTELQLEGIGAASLNHDPSIGERFANGLFGSIPGVGGIIKSAGKMGEMHEDFTAEMAERGIPGFKSQEVTLSDGSTFTIYADGSGRASPALKGNGEPKTNDAGQPIAGKPHSFPHRNDFDDLSKEDQQTIRQAQEALEQEAYDEVDAIIRQPGGMQRYNDSLRGAVEDYAQGAQQASLSVDGDFDGTDVAVTGASELAANAGLVNAPNDHVPNTPAAAPAAPAVA